MSERDVAGLLFAAEMYGVQLDQLATWLGTSEAGARAIAAHWRQQGYAESARLGPGRPWVWLTRAGLAACGLPYQPIAPALPRLAHLRAVTAVRMALESTASYAHAGAYWRSERRLRARTGRRVPVREHLPDGEVHWPDAGPHLAAVGWAGECWAIEAELTRKTIRRTAAIMTQILTRTGDYGCPATEVRVPGQLPRHARVLYVCSAAARPVVLRARGTLGTSLARRVEVRSLPPGAGLVISGGARPAAPAPSRNAPTAAGEAGP